MPYRNNKFGSYTSGMSSRPLSFPRFLISTFNSNNVGNFSYSFLGVHYCLLIVFAHKCGKRALKDLPLAAITTSSNYLLPESEEKWRKRCRDRSVVSSALPSVHTIYSVATVDAVVGPLGCAPQACEIATALRRRGHRTRCAMPVFAILHLEFLLIVLSMGIEVRFCCSAHALSPTRVHCRFQ